MERPKLEDSKKIGNMSLAGASFDYRKHLQDLNEYIDYLENELSKLHQPTVSSSAYDVKDLEERCRKANFAPYDDRLNIDNSEFKWDAHTIEIAENWLKQHHP